MKPIDVVVGKEILTIDGKRGVVHHKDMRTAPYIIYVLVDGEIKAYLGWQLKAVSDNETA